MEDHVRRATSIPKVVDYRDYLRAPLLTKYDKPCVRVDTFAIRRTGSGWGVFKIDKVCSDRDLLVGLFDSEGLAEIAARRLICGRSKNTASSSTKF